MVNAIEINQLWLSTKRAIVAAQRFSAELLYVTVGWRTKHLAFVRVVLALEAGEQRQRTQM